MATPVQNTQMDTSPGRRNALFAKFKATEYIANAIDEADWRVPV